MATDAVMPNTVQGSQISVTSCHRQQVTAGVELQALALRQSISITLKKMDGTARALKGRYKSKCPACKRNLLSLMQDDRYHLIFFFICLLVQAIRTCISSSLHCHLLPVTSSHCITMVSGTLRGIDSF